MANVTDLPSSVYHEDYTEPRSRDFIEKPPPPPINIESLLYLRRSSNAEDNECDEYGFHRNKNRYMQLADKERRLHDKLIEVNREMTDLTSRILESECETEERVLKSIYETDYTKRGLPIGRYRGIKAAIDAPVGSPISPAVRGINDGYRDPTRFKFSAIEKPFIQAPKEINMDAIPDAYFQWNMPFGGESEYMDGISKVGLINLRNQQQYTNPLIPFTRNKNPNCNVIM
ncbi:uncharacterized protein [Prorops nasuta]|uniref:uncharacterized protein n=1 Tax=Prorops nasuta TaxID=863751 RepID=UPI0034CD3BC7